MEEGAGNVTSQATHTRLHRRGAQLTGSGVGCGVGREA